MLLFAKEGIRELFPTAFQPNIQSGKEPINHQSKLTCIFYQEIFYSIYSFMYFREAFEISFKNCQYRSCQPHFLQTCCVFYIIFPFYTCAVGNILMYILYFATIPSIKYRQSDKVFSRHLFYLSFSRLEKLQVKISAMIRIRGEE